MPRLSDKCNTEHTQIYRAATADEFFARCHNMGAACNREIGLAREPYVEIVLYPGQSVTPDGEPVIHETLHALMRCTGMQNDPYHTDPRVWRQSEKPPIQSVQSRAIALMTGQ